MITMNKLIPTTLVVLTIFASFAQNLKITGKITNPTGKSVYLYILNEDRTTTFLDSAALDNSGHFQ